MIKVEYNEVKGAPGKVFETLNRKIGAYKANSKTIKIGITGRDPQTRFDEHLRAKAWKRMVVIYTTTSANFANNLEKWLVDHHQEHLFNQRAGGGSELAISSKRYLYLLLA